MLGIIRELEQIIDNISDMTVAGKKIMEYLASRSDLRYSTDNSAVVSKALHRIQSEVPPSIAVVGMTSAGKSTLINALFGHAVAETKKTRDTTQEVMKVVFPTGLVIYDTPGILGDERLENMTRAFIGLEQIPDENEFIVDSVPVKDSTNGQIQQLSAIDIAREIKIDLILWVVDTSMTRNRSVNRDLRGFFADLRGHHPNKIVVAGTHLDEIEKLSEGEKNQMLKDWSSISGGNLIPVSSTEGTGLDSLVVEVFRNVSQTVSLSKLQESLVSIRKLDRLSFVITEASSLIAGLVMLTGRQEDEIQVTSIILWSLICNHYSVDQDTWLRINGNAIKLGNEVKSAGVYEGEKERSPRTWWERVKKWWDGTKFYEPFTEYRPLGVGGIAGYLPEVYELLHSLERFSKTRYTNLIYP